MDSTGLILLIAISFLFSPNFVSCAETDTLKPGQLLRDWEQLVSAGKIFRLGFFSPNPGSTEIGPAGPRYLGIWFENIPYYSVWVGNRESPVRDSSGALTLDNNGNLKITFQGGAPIVINPSHAAKASNYPSANVTATLLDSGNFVVRQLDSDGKAGSVLWQSFDHPHNMLLPGMKLGMNLVTGKSWALTSWMSEKIPAPGAFRLGLDPDTNQLLVWRRGDVYWSSGEWQKNGSFKSASVLTKRSDMFDYMFVANEKERYFSYSIKNSSAFTNKSYVLSRWDLDLLGQITIFTLDRRNSINEWIFETTGSPCTYINTNSTTVCLMEKPSTCRNNSDEALFVPKRGYMDPYWPQYEDTNISLALSDCHASCWNNCSCMAYQDYYDGVGCKFWGKGSTFTPYDTAEFIYLLSPEK